MDNPVFVFGDATADRAVGVWFAAGFVALFVIYGVIAKFVHLAKTRRAARALINRLMARLGQLEVIATDEEVELIAAWKELDG